MHACGTKTTLNPVTNEEFAQFIESTNYQTDAEKYGWSIVQVTVDEYKTVGGANWRLPDGKHEAKKEHPVTQVSYTDALAYCRWANVHLPSYQEYWEIAKTDKRSVHINAQSIMPAMQVNTIGNTWDITTTANSAGDIRLAGGSYLCTINTCNGTDINRSLFVSKDTGNSNISFCVIK